MRRWFMEVTVPEASRSAIAKSRAGALPIAWWFLPVIQGEIHHGAEQRLLVVTDYSSSAIHSVRAPAKGGGVH